MPIGDECVGDTSASALSAGHRGRKEPTRSPVAATSWALMPEAAFAIRADEDRKNARHLRWTYVSQAEIANRPNGDPKLRKDVNAEPSCGSGARMVNPVLMSLSPCSPVFVVTMTRPPQ